MTSGIGGDEWQSCLVLSRFAVLELKVFSPKCGTKLSALFHEGPGQIRIDWKCPVSFGYFPDSDRAQCQAFEERLFGW